MERNVVWRTSSAAPTDHAAQRSLQPSGVPAEELGESLFFSLDESLHQLLIGLGASQGRTQDGRRRFHWDAARLTTRRRGWTDRATRPTLSRQVPGWTRLPASWRYSQMKKLITALVLSLPIVGFAQSADKMTSDTKAAADKAGADTKAAPTRRARHQGHDRQDGQRHQGDARTRRAPTRAARRARPRRAPSTTPRRRRTPPRRPATSWRSSAASTRRAFGRPGPPCGGRGVSLLPPGERSIPGVRGCDRPASGESEVQEIHDVHPPSRQPRPPGPDPAGRGRVRRPPSVPGAGAGADRSLPAPRRDGARGVRARARRWARRTIRTAASRR